MHRKKTRAFTLVEMMMALAISGIVFSAMAGLLGRCFSLWIEAQAQWKLAQHARVARVQLLNGAFGVGSGLLAAKEVVVDDHNGWTRLIFYPAGDGLEYHLYSWPGILLHKESTAEWAWAQTVSRIGISELPTVWISHFDAALDQEVLTLRYTLNFQSMGKRFELPQRLEAHLVNK